MNAMLAPAHFDEDEGQPIALAPGVLTGKQTDFVRFYIQLGGNASKAAELAGYAQPASRGTELTKLPHVIAAIRAEQTRLILAEGSTKSLTFMVTALDDKKLSGAVRFQCAKWLAEAAGHGLAAHRAQLGLPNADKPLSEMTLDELDAFISAGKAGIAKLKEDRERTIEGEIVRDDARSIEADDA